MSRNVSHALALPNACPSTVHCQIARFLYRMDRYCSFYHRTCIQYHSNLRNYQPRAVIKKKNGRSKRELDGLLILDAGK